MKQALSNRRLFRGRIVRRSLLTAGAVLAVSMFFLDLESLGTMQPPLYVTIALVLTWGFASALHAWMTAPARLRSLSVFATSSA